MDRGDGVLIADLMQFESDVRDVEPSRRVAICPVTASGLLAWVVLWCGLLAVIGLVGVFLGGECFEDGADGGELAGVGVGRFDSPPLAATEPGPDVPAGFPRLEFAGQRVTEVAEALGALGHDLVGGRVQLDPDTDALAELVGFSRNPCYDPEAAQRQRVAGEEALRGFVDELDPVLEMPGTTSAARSAGPTTPAPIRSACFGAGA